MATVEELWNEIKQTLGKKTNKPVNGDPINELMRSAEGINLLQREIVSKQNVKQLPRLHERLYAAIKIQCVEPSADMASLGDLLSKLGNASLTGAAGQELRFKTFLLRFECGDLDAIRGIQNELHTAWSSGGDGKSLKSMFVENEAWKSFPLTFRSGILEAVRAKVPAGAFLGELDNWIGSLTADIAGAKEKADPIREPETPADGVSLPSDVPLEPQTADVAEPPPDASAKKAKVARKPPGEPLPSLLGEQVVNGIGDIVAAMDSLGQRIEKLFAPKPDAALAERVTRLEQARPDPERGEIERLRLELEKTLKRIRSREKRMRGGMNRFGW